MMEHRALNKARDSTVLIKIRATSVYHLKIHKTTYNHSLHFNTITTSEPHQRYY